MQYLHLMNFFLQKASIGIEENPFIVANSYISPSQ